MDKKSTSAGERLQTAVLEGGPLLTIDQAAGVLGVSTVTVRRMVDAGELRAVQLGGQRQRPLRISAARLNEKLNGWSTR